MDLTKQILTDLMIRCVQIQTGTKVFELSNMDHPVCVRDLFLKNVNLPKSGLSGLNIDRLRLYLSTLIPALADEDPTRDLKEARSREEYLSALKKFVAKFSKSVDDSLNLLLKVKDMLKPTCDAYFKGESLEEEFRKLDSHTQNLLALQVMESTALSDWMDTIMPEDLRAEE